MMGSWGRRRRGFPLKLGEKLSGGRGRGAMAWLSMGVSSQAAFPTFSSEESRRRELAAYYLSEQQKLHITPLTLPCT